MEYSWPLNTPQFSLLDKLKIAKFVLTDSRWTQGKKVQEFEQKMAEYVGSRYAIFTSSGSTANTLLAMYLRDHCSPERNIVVFPSTTWITSVSPFIREGFTPRFIDINLVNFSMNLTELEEYLKKNSSKVACIFITSLIGFVPNIQTIKAMAKHYNVTVMMDNCENTLGSFENKNVSSFFTSTTSTYFGHQLQSVEGGFVFTNSLEQHDYFLMARNHGMVRSLPEWRQKFYTNGEVDSRFDFKILGNNFRNSDLNAYIGLLDFARLEEYSQKRKYLYETFVSNSSEKLLIMPFDLFSCKHVPFCLPVILSPKATKYVDLLPELVVELKKACEETEIETRPIISGNLLRQTCFKQFGFKPKDFPISEYVHKNGFYVGLYANLEPERVRNFAIKVRTYLEQQLGIAES